jgi:hypothetical protein
MLTLMQELGHSDMDSFGDSTGGFMLRSSGRTTTQEVY